MQCCWGVVLPQPCRQLISSEVAGAAAKKLGEDEGTDVSEYRKRGTCRKTLLQVPHLLEGTETGRSWPLALFKQKLGAAFWRSL